MGGPTYIWDPDLFPFHENGYQVRDLPENSKDPKEPPILIVSSLLFKQDRLTGEKKNRVQ